MKSGKWLRVYALTVGLLLSVILILVLVTDPCLHYHKPLTKIFYYHLENERYVGDGILRNMDYDALITGTSMAQNFSKTYADSLFDRNFAKVTFAAGSYYEINNAVTSALGYNPELTLVVRCLDYVGTIDASDRMAVSGEEYPDYLYDSNPFNDVKYIYNADVLIGRVYRMFKEKLFSKSFSPGITDFDAYENWMGREGFEFGPDTLLAGREGDLNRNGEPQRLTENERQAVLENIRRNLTDTADLYPEVEFYCCFTPFSAMWWQSVKENGQIYEYVEAERLAIEEILRHENIRLYSYNTMGDITLELNNYKDSIHYGEWVNTLMLKLMSEDVGRLTAENYSAYIEQELEMYLNFDYNSLYSQPDWEDRYTAERILNEKYAFK